MTVKNSTTPQVSKFFQIFKRDKGRCVYCGLDMKSWNGYIMASEDHLIPKNHKRKSDLDNLVLACFVCNRLKGNYVPKGAKRKERIADARNYISQQWNKDKRRQEYDRLMAFLQIP